MAANGGTLEGTPPAPEQSEEPDWRDSFGSVADRDDLLASHRYGFVPRTILDFKNDDKWHLPIPNLEELMGQVEHRRSFAFEDGGIGKSLRATAFNSGLCKFLVQYYTDRGQQVLDPFAGWGTRAYVCRRLGRNYLGYDVVRTTVDAVNGALARVEQRAIDGEKAYGLARVILGDGCKLEGMDDASADALFTCPPYHDREVYGEAAEGAGYQLSRVDRYYFELFMRRAFERWRQVLKRDALAVFVVSDWRDHDTGEYYPFTHKLQEWAFAAGFTMHDFAVHGLRSLTVRGVSSFMQSRILPRAHENIVVFRRG